MTPVSTVTGRMVPLDRSDIDTDQIIPQQFLKRIERDGYGEFLFYNWAHTDDGSPSSDFILNDPIRHGAKILVTGPNVGLLVVELPEDVVSSLIDLATNPASEVTIDLESQTVTAEGIEEHFEFDPTAKDRLLRGLDPIGVTLTHEEAIAAHEATRPGRLPVTVDA
jgi:3-isopropylmalate/(R)-2-methylmalate dehydratase small subunit